MVGSPVKMSEGGQASPARELRGFKGLIQKLSQPKAASSPAAGSFDTKDEPGKHESQHSLTVSVPDEAPTLLPAASQKQRRQPLSVLVTDDDTLEASSWQSSASQAQSRRGFDSPLTVSIADHVVEPPPADERTLLSRRLPGSDPHTVEASSRRPLSVSVADHVLEASHNPFLSVVSSGHSTPKADGLHLTETPRNNQCRDHTLENSSPMQQKRAGSHSRQAIGRRSSHSSVSVRSSPSMRAYQLQHGRQARENRESVLECMRHSQLFQDLLFGNRLIGKARVFRSVLSPEHGKCEIRLEDEAGNAVTGMNNKRSIIAISWERAQGRISIAVGSARNLPKMDRFGLCDSQVMLEFDDSTETTSTVRDSLNPEFHERCSFPWNPADERPLEIAIYHMDMLDDLSILADGCQMETIEQGALLLQGDGRMVDRMFILKDGCLGVYDSNSKVTHDNETLVRSLTPGGAKTRRMVEIGRVNQPGACMAEAAVLLGEKTKTTIGTITPTTVAWIPAEAFRVALKACPSLAERLAYTLQAHREQNATLQTQDPDSMTISVHIESLHSLPEWVNLDYGESDLTCFLELNGQRQSTKSLRWTRSTGYHPKWDQTFVFENVKSVNSYLQISVWDLGEDGEIKDLVGRIDLALVDLLFKRHFGGDLALKAHSEEHGIQRPDAKSVGPLLNPEAAKRLTRQSQAGTPDGDESPLLLQRTKAFKFDARSSLKSLTQSVHSPHDEEDLGLFAGFRRKHREVHEDEESETESDDSELSDEANNKDDRFSQHHPRPNKQQPTDGGVLSLHVMVTGRWYEGERDFLTALGMMGFESHSAALKDAGFSTVQDFAQNIDDAHLARVFPDMKRSRRRVFMQRLAECRRCGFLGREGRELARVIRYRHGVNPKSYQSQEKVAEKLWEQSLQVGSKVKRRAPGHGHGHVGKEADKPLSPPNLIPTLAKAAAFLGYIDKSF